jgi:hypothetical protein
MPFLETLGGAALLGAGGSLLNSLFSSGSQRAAEERQWKRQVQMWNMNNEYNKPVNQVLRLKEAGLNPALMYGNGSASVGNSSSFPKPSYTADQSPVNFGDIADRIMSLVTYSKQLQNMDAEIQRKQIDNKLAEQQYDYRKIMYRNYELYGGKTMSANLDKIMKDVENIRLRNVGQFHSNRIANYNAAYQDSYLWLRNKQLAENIRLLYLNQSNVDASTRQKYADIALTQVKTQAAALGIRVTDKQLQIMSQTLHQAVRENKINDWLFGEGTFKNRVYDNLPEAEKLRRLFIDNMGEQYRGGAVDHVTNGIGYIRNILDVLKLMK